MEKVTRGGTGIRPAENSAGAGQCPSDRALKVREVASILGVGLTLTRRLIRSGEITSVKIGGAVRVRESALSHYLARVTTPAGGSRG